MYFKFFPYTYYDVEQNEDYKLVCDILRRVDILEGVRKTSTVYLDYIVSEGDSPESIADKLYGNPGYFWIVLHMNNMINPYKDWPMSSDQLSRYVTRKYGEDNEYDVHHYEDADGYVVDPTTPLAAAISNYDHEDRLNESRRKIRLLIPELVAQIQGELEAILTKPYDQRRV